MPAGRIPGALLHVGKILSPGTPPSAAVGNDVEQDAADEKAAQAENSATPRSPA
jgi:hypothetical protein